MNTSSEDAGGERPAVMPLLPREDPNASVWNYCPLDATMHAPRDADMRAAMLARHWLAVRLMEDPAQRSEVIQMPRAVADALGKV